MKVQSKIFKMSSALIVAIVASSSGYSINAQAGLFGGKSKIERKTEKLIRKEEKREDLEDAGRGDSWRHSKMVGDAAKTRDQLRALLDKQDADRRAAERIAARYDRDQENQRREEELERIRRRDRERYEEARYDRDVHSSTNSRTTDDYSNMAEEIYSRAGQCPQGYLEDETEEGHCVRFDLWTPGKCENVGKGNSGKQGNNGKQGTDPVTPPSPLPSPEPSPAPSPDPEYCDLTVKEIVNGKCVDKNKHPPIKEPTDKKDPKSKPSTKTPTENKTVAKKEEKHASIKDETGKGKGGKGVELAKVKADKDASDAEKAAALKAKKEAEDALLVAKQKAADEKAELEAKNQKLRKENETKVTLNGRLKQKNVVREDGDKSKGKFVGDVTITGTAEGAQKALDEMTNAKISTKTASTNTNTVKTFTNTEGTVKSATTQRSEQIKTIMAGGN